MKLDKAWFLHRFGPRKSGDNAFVMVSEYLAQNSVARIQGLPITLETAVYQDVRLYGDDVFELVLWLHYQFEVEMNFAFGVYAPGEAGLFDGLVRLVGKLCGNPRIYQRLTVRDILFAIDAKRWPDVILGH